MFTSFASLILRFSFTFSLFVPFNSSFLFLISNLFFSSVVGYSNLSTFFVFVISVFILVMANWTNLSQDLLRMISDFSLSPYHFRMQSVCKSWRSILKNSDIRELPWLMMLPKDKEEDPNARDFFSLSKQKIFTIRIPEMHGKRCCGSFQNGWLMTVDIDLNVCLFHPWSNKKLDLPHQFPFKEQCLSGGRCTIEEIRDMCILRAALSDDANMVVVVVHAIGNLAFCRVGDDAWTDIDNSDADEYWEDVIYHKGRFYALGHLGGLFILRAPEEGVDRPWVVERLTEDLEPFGLLYLVPDVLTDSMFMIVREVERMDLKDDEEDPNPPPPPRPRPYPRQPHRTVHFDIYKTSLGEEAPNEELNKWMKVESLGDRIVFLGYNSAMMIIASKFPGFKGNLIYFADTCVYNYFRSPHGCCDNGVFNVEDNTVVEQLFADRFHPTSAPPLWIATPPYSF